MTEAESSFHLPCFEDDFEKHTEEINDYYEYLQTHDYIELNWKCPGRKTPQKKIEDSPKVSETPKEQWVTSQMEFDFQDEPEPNPGTSRTPVSRTKSSSLVKKKATTFSQIMDKMKKSQTPK